jgi:hypothetical protein
MMLAMLMVDVMAWHHGIHVILVIICKSTQGGSKGTGLVVAEMLLTIRPTPLNMYLFSL